MMGASFIRSCILVLAAGLAGSPAFALQSGGVEVGDLETGSVIGQSFKALDVDLSLTAMNVGGKNAWYPPTSVLSLSREGTGARGGRPVVIQVTNKLASDYTFHLAADSSQSGPWSLNTTVVLKPGETKYIGIPISDLTYVTTNNVLRYLNPSDPQGLGGQLLILR
ncbi:MAG: hypothetical protein R3B83_07875 [Nitrospirales bacterium]|nr:hypothetical protein [Nitrospirales bacterium]